MVVVQPLSLPHLPSLLMEQLQGPELNLDQWVQGHRLALSEKSGQVCLATAAAHQLD